MSASTGQQASRRPGGARAGGSLRATWLVASREIRLRAKTRVFIVTTAIVLIAVALAVALPAILSGNSKPDRIGVVGGGCSGFQYKFDTEHAKAEDDVVIERAGATVLIDPVSLNYMVGSEIDFVDDLIGSSFKINNPNATASCGCGTSFAL